MPFGLFASCGSPHDKDQVKEANVDAAPEAAETTDSDLKMPVVQSKHSLVYKHFNQEVWDKCKGKKTATSGITIDQCIACAVQLDNQHCGIYAGDADCYVDYACLFDPIIDEYHNYGPDKKHTSDLNVENLNGNINDDIPVVSTRIRVGRNIEGFGLSPGITKEQRLGVEALMKEAFAQLEGDLAGTYYPLQGMDEATRQQLVEDHFLFKSGDANLQIAGMERDWPEGRGIFHNTAKTFLVWVNEEDQLRIISMQKGGNVREVFERLARGIAAIEAVITAKGHKFAFSDRVGYIHSCPTNLGTGMRASVHVPLPNLAKDKANLKAMCESMSLQPRGAHGESSGDTGVVFDISNKHRLGYSEVQLVQTMIDGVNSLYSKDQEASPKSDEEAPQPAAEPTVEATAEETVEPTAEAEAEAAPEEPAAETAEEAPAEAE